MSFHLDPVEYSVSAIPDLSGLDDAEFGELKALNQKVYAASDEYEPWDALVRAAEGVEGGLNRNSSPQAIAAFREIYNRFLAKFPLFFVYWKRYADKEFIIAGTEAAESVYERGVASIPNSVDLWMNYCNFKVETSHDTDVIRELFERGSSQVGLDFLSAPFWDKYLEFEDRSEQPQNVFAILDRVVRIPTQKFRDYFDKFRSMAAFQPLESLWPASALTQWHSELQSENPNMTPEELDRALRARVDAAYLTIYNTTQGDIVQRAVHEDAIRRPYFHVTEIDEAELAVWRKYLDFEEQQGNYERTRFLYERCVVICALYEEFWLRYVRWLSAMSNKTNNRTEDIRIVYQRACTIFVPIVKPTIRLHYALFEESQGRISVSKDMHYAILDKLPGHLDTIVSLANLERRHGGIDAAIQVFKSFITDNACDMFAKGFLVAEWANMLWKVKGSVEEAREIFRSQAEYYGNSRPFWVNYFFFELQQQVPPQQAAEQHERTKKVFDDMSRSQILPSAVRDVANYYKAYLLERGPADAAKEYLEVDRKINGPQSIRLNKSHRLAEDNRGFGPLYAESNSHAGDSALRLGFSASSRFPREASEMAPEY